MVGTIGASKPETGIGVLIPEQITASDQISALESLTERELEVLGLIANGDSNPTIAEKLCIEPGTVKNHTRRIYSNLPFGERVNKRVKAILIYRERYPFEFVEHEVMVDLTPKEYEVLSLIAQGYSNLSIAKRLGIEPGTVKGYTKRIYSKLPFGEGADKRVLAALIYYRTPIFLSSQLTPPQLH